MTTNVGVGIRARNSGNLVGGLATGSITGTGFVVLTRSVPMGRNRHFAGVHRIRYSAGRTVGGTLALLRDW